MYAAFSDAAGGLVNDIMTNGLSSLITAVMEEVPEAGVLTGILADGQFLKICQSHQILSSCCGRRWTAIRPDP